MLPQETLPLPLLDSADPSSFDEKVFAPRGELVVVYFWGKNCPNCEVFARYLPGLLEALRGAPLRIVKVNVYEHMSLATRFALVGIPAFLLVRDGKKLGKLSEFYDKDTWLGIIQEHLPEPA